MRALTMLDPVDTEVHVGKKMRQIIRLCRNRRQFVASFTKIIKPDHPLKVPDLFMPSHDYRS